MRQFIKDLWCKLFGGLGGLVGKLIMVGVIKAPYVVYYKNSDDDLDYQFIQGIVTRGEANRYTRELQNEGFCEVHTERYW